MIASTEMTATKPPPARARRALKLASDLIRALWPRDAFVLALRNIFRHRGRTALTLTVIASGVAGLILCGGFVQDALIQLREATIHSQLGHLQIYRKGYYAEGSRSPYKFMIERPGEILAAVRELPEVDDAMSRLAFTGVINNGRSDFAIVGEGIEADKEARLGSLIQIISGRKLAGADRYGMVIGEGVASATKLKPGDRATLLLNTAEGALNSIEFDVVGIFRSFAKDFDARAVRISLSGAHELLASSGGNAVVVSLLETVKTDEAAARLKTKLDGTQYEIKTWRELADFYDKTAALYERQFAVLQAIILLAVLLSVVNSVNMSVFERTGEFGTLMALGTRSRSIFRLVLLENLLLGLIGSCIGTAIGIIAAWAISAIGIPMPPPPNSSSGYIATIRVDAAIVLTAWVVGFAATVVASIMPARRVARVPVVEALRQN